MKTLVKRYCDPRLTPLPQFLALLAIAGCVAAKPAPLAEALPNDPRRPVDKISRDLNITPAQFVDCFRNVSPAPQGTRPTSDRVHANKRILLSCLQRANPAITNELLDTVMDRYRPGGREAQQPQN